MRYYRVAGAAIVAIVASSMARAQDATLTITPEHEQVIREYVVKEHVRPVDMDDNFVVGATVPQTVELAPVPEGIYTTAPEVRRYQYFYWKNRVVFVDPDSRRIVKVVD